MNSSLVGPINRLNSNPPDMTTVDRVRALLALRCGASHSRLRVSDSDGAILLEGEVARYYDRQMALTCAQHVPGVRRIVDRIVVREPAVQFAESIVPSAAPLSDAVESLVGAKE